MSNLACHDVRLELVAFLDGELSEPVRTGIEAHLAACAACAAERQALDGVWDALDHLLGLEARPGWLAELEANVLAAAGDAAPVEIMGEDGAAPLPSLAPVSKLPWALAAAAGLLMGGGVSWWMLAGDPAPHQPQVAPATGAPRVEAPERPDVRVPKQELVPDVEVPKDDPSRFDLPATPTPTPAPTQTPEPPAIAQRELEAELAKLDPVERKVVENLQALALLEAREDNDVIQNIDLLDDLDEDELDEG